MNLIYKFVFEQILKAQVGSMNKWLKFPRSSVWFTDSAEQYASISKKWTTVATLYSLIGWP